MKDISCRQNKTGCQASLFLPLSSDAPAQSMGFLTEWVRASGTGWMAAHMHAQEHMRAKHAPSLCSGKTISLSSERALFFMGNLTTSFHFWGKDPNSRGTSKKNSIFFKIPP
jgi:hypothetical protein